MNDTKIPSEADQTLLLATVQGLPPLTIYAEARTPDQVKEIKVIREHFADLGAALRAYFSGVQNPVGLNDHKRRAMITNDVEFYLAVYNLFWFGWDQIMAGARQELSPEDLAVFPSSPGAALAMVLEGDCDAMCEVALSGTKISVRECRTLLHHGIPDQGDHVGTALKRANRTVAYSKEVLDRASLSGRLIGFSEKAVSKRLRGQSSLRRKHKEFKAALKRHTTHRRKLLIGVKGS